MNNPLVTVLSLTYKKFDTLYNALDSILSQDYSNIQIVISDDGTPNFNEQRRKIEAFIRKNRNENLKDYKISHLDSNQGTVKNLNNALQLSDGKYIIGISDDLFSSNQSLSKLIRFAEQNNSLIISSCVEKVDRISGKTLKIMPPKRYIKKLKKMPPEKLNKRLWNGCIFPSTGVMYNRKIFEDYGYFDERYRYIEDQPFQIMITRNGVRIHFMEEVVTKYFTGGISNSGGNPGLKILLKNDYLNIIKNEVEPYNNKICKNIDNFLRRRRAEFVFSFDYSRLFMIKNIKTAVKYPDAGIFYICRALKNKLYSI